MTDYLPEIVRRAARAQPGRVWMRNVDGRSCTWAELDQEARRWRTRFERLGVGAGDTVAVLLPNSFAALTTWLGLVHLGAVQVPVNVEFRGRMLAHVLRDCAARVVVVDAGLVPYVLAVQDQLRDLPRFVVVEGPGLSPTVSTDDEILTDLPPAPDEERWCAPWETSCILYTSGTTGPSKGVITTWAQLHETSRTFLPIDDLTAADTVYCPLPFFHLSGRILLYLAALLDADLVFRPRFSGSAFWEDVRRFGCRTTMLMGTMGTFLESLPETDEDATTPLSNVFMAPVPEDPARFRERFGLRIATAFNMTETSCPIVSDGWDVTDARTVGRVRKGFEVRIVDEHDIPVADGVAGQLVIRADQPWMLMNGYWNRPDATLDAWRNQWFHTGDLLVRRPDGAYAFLDRLKDAIRRRGENISSAEVEADVALCRDVAEVAAVPVPSQWGDDEVLICVVPVDGRTLDPGQLYEELKTRMTRFMLPRYIEVLEELPKTHTSKVRKADLRSRPMGEHVWDAEAVR